jgi:DNA-binding transcriptional LysR family regulator
MRDTNLAGIDLNLLPALEALLRRRHVTLAAADVGLSQPAMSRALGRLRHLLGDPLLVRGSRGLTLTTRAQALLPRLTHVLAGARGLLQPPAFEPDKVRRTLRIAASDAQTVGLLPRIVARLKREAPGLELVAVPYSLDMAARFESGELDLAFALASADLPPGAHSTPIGRDRLALILRKGHPWARRRWTLADYARFEHVTVSIFGDQRNDIDSRLATAGVSRRIGLTTPHFMAALAAVGASDMIATLSETLARQFADTFGLVLRPPPFAGREMIPTLVCSAARADDPLLRWFCAIASDAGQADGAATEA